MHKQAIKKLKSGRVFPFCCDTNRQQIGGRTVVADVTNGQFVRLAAEIVQIQIVVSALYLDPNRLHAFGSDLFGQYRGGGLYNHAHRGKFELEKGEATPT